jgi:hypothetical protein
MRHTLSLDRFDGIVWERGKIGPPRKERQFLDDDGNEVGLDHSSLYLEGRLIDGLSIHGDPPGHEGENLREAMGRFCSHLEELESKRKETRTKGPKERYTQ